MVGDAQGAATVEHPATVAQPRDVAELCAALAGRGHEVRYYPGQDGSSALAAFVPDVVHAQCAAGPPGDLSAGGRLVVTARSLATTSPQLLRQRADRIIVPATHHVPRLMMGGVPRRRIVAIPPGVDTNLFRPGRAGGPTRHGHRRILAVGQLASPAGMADLILAMRQVPTAELVIVAGPGRGMVDGDPIAARLIELAERARVADRVRLLVGVAYRDMPDYYRSAQVVACVPRDEALGTAALEAMACGVPIAGYAVGGLRDSVIDGVTGVLVPPGDRRALGVALRRLLADDVRRMSYATAAVDRVRSRYEWPRLAADTERVYWEALRDIPLSTG